MTDLRFRLATALNSVGHCEHPGAESCEPWWQADAVTQAFAQWLRDIADTTWTPDSAHVLHSLAEALEARDADFYPVFAHGGHVAPPEVTA